VKRVVEHDCGTAGAKQPCHLPGVPAQRLNLRVHPLGQAERPQMEADTAVGQPALDLLADEKIWQVGVA
jgi:hypothetical protein